MIKVNETIFKLYLAVLESFSKNISCKYEKESTSELKRFMAIFIREILLMFHTLKSFVEDSKDEASARCILRGIVDRVTIFCFIYEKEDKEEILFRHYLYVLDGVKSYQESVIKGAIGDVAIIRAVEYLCEKISSHAESRLSSHPYSNLNNKAIRNIVENRNWKYESMQKPHKLKFREMYKRVGFDDKVANYYQGYLSQFAHGLLFSNYQCHNMEQMKRVLLESINPLERIIQSINNIFKDDDLCSCFLQSDSYKALIRESNFKFNDLCQFVNVIRNRQTIYI